MKNTNLMRSIQFQIIIILVAVVTIILLGFGISDYLKIEQDLNEKLEKTAGRITSRLSLAMVTPIWDFDEELARRIISSEMDLEELYAVFVYDGDDKNLFMALEKDAEGKLKTATALPEGNLVMQAADIVRKDKTIGVVNIYLTRDILEAAIAAELRGIIVNTLIIDALIILILFIVIRTKLIQPVKVIQTFANDVSEGNLDSVFGKGNFSGELIDLKDAVLRMVANLKKTIEEVGVKEKEAAESAKEACKALTEAEEARLEGERARQEGMQEASNILKDISENIMTAADEQAQRVEQVNAYTTQQRDRASETATAMEEMNATVLEVAQNASLAAESADSSKQKASFGSGKVSELVASINDVSSLSETMKANLQELGRHAEGIGSIMNVITDIADQTNLLALNAAIEAARAGDAGRGFAVVADEVRKLAEKTVHATQEVEEVVRAIQNSSNQNIKGMEETTKAVNQSKELAGEAGAALSEILSIVESTSDQVRSIATASEEQSASSEEINRAMEDINTIANDISSDMQRATNALMRMKELSTKLMELIRKLESE